MKATKELQVYVVGDVGTGKSALLGIIEDRLKDLGVEVVYDQPNDAEYERNMVDGKWEESLATFQPIKVTLFEKGAVPKLEITQIPTTCDAEGLEQKAFEDTFGALGFDMSEHPMHYLFVDEKTDAARKGWREAINYVHGRLTEALSENLKKRQQEGRHRLMDLMTDNTAQRREAKARFITELQVNAGDLMQLGVDVNLLPDTKSRNASLSGSTASEAHERMMRTLLQDGDVLRVAGGHFGEQVTLTEAVARRHASHRHYKGGLYRYLGKAKHTETGEELTVYAHLYPHPVQVFVRPTAMFNEPLEDGRPRFMVLPYVSSPDRTYLDVRPSDGNAVAGMGNESTKRYTTMYLDQSLSAEGYQLSDDVVASVVNELRDIAVEYRDAQQLRERIAHLIVPYLTKTAPKPTGD